MIKKCCAMTVAILFCLSLFAACAKRQEENTSQRSSLLPEPGTSSEQDDKTLKIACIYGSITGEFWEIVYNGCMAALEELQAGYGVEGYCVAPADNTNVEQQIELIKQAVEQEEVDGIVLSSMNAAQIGSFITEYFHADNWTPVILIDRSCNTDSDVIVSKVLSDTYAMGIEAGKQAARAVNGNGSYFCLGVLPDTPDWVDRSLGAMDYLTQNEPNMRQIGETIYWMGQEGRTQEDQIAYIQKTVCSVSGEVCILPVTEGYTNTAVLALAEMSSERRQHTKIVGFDFSEDFYQLIVQEKVYATIAQNPYLMGYRSTYYLLEYLLGAELQERIDIPYTMVTKENLQEEAVQEYLVCMGISL